jgi:Bacterial PH domain
MACTGLVVAAQSIRGSPLLEATDAGISIYNPWGPLFVRWSDVVEFSAGNFRWLRIRLREGAQPAGPSWVRMLSASVWARNTVVVQMFTTVPRPLDVARALTELQARHLAG